MRAIWSRKGIGLLSICASLVVSMPAVAAVGWTGFGQVTRINQQPPTGAGANLVFVDTTVTVNPSGCSYGSGFYFAVVDDRTKRLLAMLMAAQLASRQVQIYTTGTCHDPWGYAQLDGLEMQ